MFYINLCTCVQMWHINGMNKQSILIIKPVQNKLLSNEIECVSGTFFLSAVKQILPFIIQVSSNVSIFRFHMCKEQTFLCILRRNILNKNMKSALDSFLGSPSPPPPLKYTHTHTLTHFRDQDRESMHSLIY